MKTDAIFPTLLAGLALLAGSGGCSAPTDEPSMKADSGQEFVSPGKISAPVTMTHQLSAKPAIGQPMQLELVFDSPGEPIQVEIRADDGLAMTPQTGRSVSDGGRVIVDLTPQAEGRFYVNVIARLGQGSAARAKVFSIPVQVGIGTISTTAEKATTGPDGERLIRMQSVQKEPD